MNGLRDTGSRVRHVWDILMVADAALPVTPANPAVTTEPWGGESRQGVT